MPAPAWSRLLGRLNALPLGDVRVRVGRNVLVADSLDRLVACLGWKLGWLERRERLFIGSTVRAGMVAVDVGANLGFHTLALAEAVGPTGRVHAVEPEPRNFRALQRAVELAALDQVRLSRVAATERSGPTFLDLSAANRGDHRVDAPDPRRPRIPVVGLALDELLADESGVDFVKIDVQGNETAVLRGLADTLRRSPDPVVLCELCPLLLGRAGVDFEGFFLPLRALGLEPHLLDSRGMAVPVDPERAWSEALRSTYRNVAFRRR